MSYPATRIFLTISGTIGVLIGVSILFMPHALFVSNGVTLETDPNLMSEIRAPGGLLIAAGVIMSCGALKKSLFRIALLTAALVFSMYGVSRMVSLALDGVPSSILIAALTLELAVGGIAIFLNAKLGAAQSEFGTGHLHQPKLWEINNEL